MYCFIILLHFIFSVLLTRCLFVPYAFVSIESIECILLSLLALNAISLTSSVNTLCFMPLNLCCDFNINFLLFMNSLWFSLRLSTLTWYFLVILFYFQVELLLKIFIIFKFKFSFYYTPFCVFIFILISLPYIKKLYAFVVLMKQTLSLFFIPIHLLLIR